MIENKKPQLISTTHNLLQESPFKDAEINQNAQNAPQIGTPGSSASSNCSSANNLSLLEPEPKLSPKSVPSIIESHVESVLDNISKKFLDYKKKSKKAKKELRILANILIDKFLNSFFQKTKNPKIDGESDYQAQSSQNHPLNPYFSEKLLIRAFETILYEIPFQCLAIKKSVHIWQKYLDYCSQPPTHGFTGRNQSQAQRIRKDKNLNQICLGDKESIQEKHMNLIKKVFNHFVLQLLMRSKDAKSEGYLLQILIKICASFDTCFIGLDSYTLRMNIVMINELFYNLLSQMKTLNAPFQVKKKILVGVQDCLISRFDVYINSVLKFYNSELLESFLKPVIEFVSIAQEMELDYFQKFSRKFYKGLLLAFFNLDRKINIKQENPTSNLKILNTFLEFIKDIFDPSVSFKLKFFILNDFLVFREQCLLNLIRAVLEILMKMKMTYGEQEFVSLVKIIDFEYTSILLRQQTPTQPFLNKQGNHLTPNRAPLGPTQFNFTNQEIMMNKLLFLFRKQSDEDKGSEGLGSKTSYDSAVIYNKREQNSIDKIFDSMQGFFLEFDYVDLKEVILRLKTFYLELYHVVCLSFIKFMEQGLKFEEVSRFFGFVILKKKHLQNMSQIPSGRTGNNRNTNNSQASPLNQPKMARKSIAWIVANSLKLIFLQNLKKTGANFSQIKAKINEIITQKLKTKIDPTVHKSVQKIIYIPYAEGRDHTTTSLAAKVKLKMGEKPKIDNILNSLQNTLNEYLFQHTKHSFEQITSVNTFNSKPSFLLFIKNFLRNLKESRSEAEGIQLHLNYFQLVQGYTRVHEESLDLDRVWNIYLFFLISETFFENDKEVVLRVFEIMLNNYKVIRRFFKDQSMKEVQQNIKCLLESENLAFESELALSSHSSLTDAFMSFITDGESFSTNTLDYKSQQIRNQKVEEMTKLFNRDFMGTDSGRLFFRGFVEKGKFIDREIFEEILRDLLVSWDGINVTVKTLYAVVFIVSILAEISPKISISLVPTFLDFLDRIFDFSEREQPARARILDQSFNAGLRRLENGQIFAKNLNSFFSFKVSLEAPQSTPHSQIISYLDVIDTTGGVVALKMIKSLKKLVISSLSETTGSDQQNSLINQKKKWKLIFLLIQKFKSKISNLERDEEGVKESFFILENCVMDILKNVRHLKAEGLKMVVLPDLIMAINDYFLSSQGNENKDRLAGGKIGGDQMTSKGQAEAQTQDLGGIQTQKIVSVYLILFETFKSLESNLQQPHNKNSSGAGYGNESNRSSKLKMVQNLRTKFLTKKKTKGTKNTSSRKKTRSSHTESTTLQEQDKVNQNISNKNSATTSRKQVNERFNYSVFTIQTLVKHIIENPGIDKFLALNLLQLSILKVNFDVLDKYELVIILNSLAVLTVAQVDHISTILAKSELDPFVNISALQFVPVEFLDLYSKILGAQLKFVAKKGLLKEVWRRFVKACYEVYKMGELASQGRTVKDSVVKAARELVQMMTSLKVVSKKKSVIGIVGSSNGFRMWKEVLAVLEEECCTQFRREFFELGEKMF